MFSLKPLATCEAHACCTRWTVDAKDNKRILRGEKLQKLQLDLSAWADAVKSFGKCKLARACGDVLLPSQLLGRGRAAALCCACADRSRTHTVDRIRMVAIHPRSRRTGAELGDLFFLLPVWWNGLVHFCHCRQVGNIWLRRRWLLVARCMVSRRNFAMHCTWE
jgi:hypothetical protein